MKVTKQQLRKLIIESLDDENNDSAPPATESDQDLDAEKIAKLKAFIGGDASIQSIDQAIMIADGLSIDPMKLQLAFKPTILKMISSLSKPTMDDINKTINMLKTLRFDDMGIRSIIQPAFIRFVQTGNTLDSVQATNIIDEIDDNLFRARDLGLKTLGVGSADSLRNAGKLTDDQIYDIDMELINSVKDKAREAIERSIAQIYAATLK